MTSVNDLITSYRLMPSLMMRMLIGCQNNAASLASLCGNIDKMQHHTPKPEKCGIWGFFLDFDPDPEPEQWIIQAIHGYSTHLIFTKFETMYSENCSLNSLELILNTNDEEQTQYILCGYLPPWNQTCPCIKTTLSLSTTWDSTHLSIKYMIRQRLFLSIYTQPTTFNYTTTAFNPLDMLDSIFNTWEQIIYISIVIDQRYLFNMGTIQSSNDGK